MTFNDDDAIKGFLQFNDVPKENAVTFVRLLKDLSEDTQLDETSLADLAKKVGGFPAGFDIMGLLKLITTGESSGQLQIQRGLRTRTTLNGPPMPPPSSNSLDFTPPALRNSGGCQDQSSDGRAPPVDPCALSPASGDPEDPMGKNPTREVPMVPSGVTPMTLAGSREFMVSNTDAVPNIGSGDTEQTGQHNQRPIGDADMSTDNGKSENVGDAYTETQVLPRVGRWFLLRSWFNGLPTWQYVTLMGIMVVLVFVIVGVMIASLNSPNSSPQTAKTAPSEPQIVRITSNAKGQVSTNSAQADGVGMNIPVIYAPDSDLDDAAVPDAAMLDAQLPDVEPPVAMAKELDHGNIPKEDGMIDVQIAIDQVNDTAQRAYDTAAIARAGNSLSFAGQEVLSDQLTGTKRDVTDLRQQVTTLQAQVAELQKKAAAAPAPQPVQVLEPAQSDPNAGLEGCISLISADINVAGGDVNHGVILQSCCKHYPAATKCGGS